MNLEIDGRKETALQVDASIGSADDDLPSGLLYTHVNDNTKKVWASRSVLESETVIEQDLLNSNLSGIL